MNEVMPFGDVLEAVDQLSEDEQHALVTILQRRLAHAGRRQLAIDAQDAWQEFNEGRCRATNGQELMREILE